MDETWQKIVASATILGTLFTACMLYLQCSDKNDIVVAGTETVEVVDEAVDTEAKTSTTEAGTIDARTESAEYLQTDDNTFSNDVSSATILLFETRTPYYSQTNFWGPTINSGEINNNQKEGRMITSVAYTKNGWFISMAKGSGLYSQSSIMSKDFPSDWIKKQYHSENRLISSIAYNGDMWYIICSKGTGFSAQSVQYVNKTKFEDSVVHYQSKGYFITNASFDSRYDAWVLVFSKGSQFSSQGYFLADSREDLIQKTETYVYDKKYRIHLIEKGDKFLCVYGTYKDKKPGQKPRTITWDCDTLKSMIENITSNGSYKLQYVGGCPKM